MTQKQDDGRRKMPKSFCPYCNHRVMDSKTVKLRREVRITTATDEAAEHFIICNHCSKLIGIIFTPTIALRVEEAYALQRQ